MKKRVAIAVSTLMLAGSVTAPASAESVPDHEMSAMMQEVQDIENYQFSGTSYIEADEIAFGLNINGQTGTNGSTDIVATVRVDIPSEDFYYELQFEDVIRVLPDAYYLNVGEILDTIAEIMGNGIVPKIGKMAGLDEPWVRISRDFSSFLPQEEWDKLIADANDLYNMDFAWLLPYMTEIEDGYQIAIDNEIYIQMLTEIFENMDEGQLETVIDDALNFAAAFDNSMLTQNAYINAALEGILEIDPEFDAEGLLEELEAELDMEEVREQLASVNGAMVIQAMKEEGYEFSDLPQLMREELENAEMELNLTCSMTKANDLYQIVLNEEMEADGEKVYFVSGIVIEPVDEFAVIAPEECMDIEELIKNLSSTIYLFYMIPEVDEGVLPVIIDETIDVIPNETEAE